MEYEHSKPIKHGTKEGITHITGNAKSEAMKKAKDGRKAPNLYKHDYGCDVCGGSGPTKMTGRQGQWEHVYKCKNCK